MKKMLLIVGLMLCSFLLNAQEKIKNVVTDNYDRNSVSYMIVDRGDSFTSNINAFHNEMKISEKFDVNLIPTRKYKTSVSRPNVLAQEEVDAFISSNKLGNEIISYIYNRKSDGSFDDSILTERGLYNATDQDMMNAAAAKVSELSLEWGETLMNSAYVIVLDFYNLKKTT